MNEFSCFSGIGAGDLKSWLYDEPWDCVGYLERDRYCCEVLAARIGDGLLSDAPIFNSDLREWLRLGYAEAYKGLVDVFSAGPPCQPFSCGGKLLGGSDPRNMWPATLEAVRRIGPRFLSFENVSGLLFKSHNYWPIIQKELAEIGYDVRWRCLSAAECGGAHRRDRVWIVAYARGERFSSIQSWPRRRIKAIPESTLRRSTGRGSLGRIWPTSESEIFGVDDGPAFRLERLKAVGGCQFPSVAATAPALLGLDPL